ncbi:MDR efflux pump AcrAB transcriptional activator RobA [Sodalis sp. RH22]|uniref:MDR efflux pump AcrAB transcriptional activator RobA n=1 Tax=unclassified Sodalis (in: enterobacteria) TaxID=2636512 RepID=UPI0039B483F1
MAEADTIYSLLYWLDNHLDLPLKLDNVAAKSGYSKWHLQRMFRYVTGQTLGAYIRARRLSRSAVALRVSSRSILDIALQYHFDSQQTFTRAFKKQFGITPAVYRQSADWPSKGLCPPIRMEAATWPQPDFIKLPDMSLMGAPQIYHTSLEHLSRFLHSDLRLYFWQQFLDKVNTVPPFLYGLHRLVAGAANDIEQDITLHYTTAVPAKEYITCMPMAGPVMIEGGDYAQFTYEGAIEGFQDFIILIYDTAVPLLGLTRRQGQDIERFSLGQQVKAFPESIVRCDYLIPILR